MHIVARALIEDKTYHMGLRPLAGARGLQRHLHEPRIQKSGLAIAGLTQSIKPGRVQVLGSTEVMYLNSLEPQHERAALSGLFAANVPCVVVTGRLEASPTLLALADELGICLLATDLPSGTFIGRVHDFFDEHLSPRITLHGVLLDVFGVGVMLTGHSGIGKSECALDLVLRGHQLVADDMVLVRRRDLQLVGTGSPLTKHHMEVRGLGIINVKDLFGAASVCAHKTLGLLVEMVEWQREAEYDRLGLDDNLEDILGAKVPRLRLPVRPGRNLASIVEVAARNHLLKAQGHHAAQRLQRRLERRLAAADPTPLGAEAPPEASTTANATSGAPGASDED